MDLWRMEKATITVWVFVGENGRFPGGVFSKKENAEHGIKKYDLSGILTLYPLDEGVYDWAIHNEFFSPKKEAETQADFIQRFTTASQEHYHFEDGELS